MKTNLKLTQNGRSMVEMLGVLAIIGVLSVAGVQGYTTAMNKHRANEILNEASKRAVVVAAQIASGRTPTLTEFTDNEVGGAEFSTTVEKVDDNKFRIGYVSGKEPSEAVLAQMKNIAGENGMIQGFTGGLTYNNDLGIQNGTNESKSSAGESCGEDGECASNKCASSGICCSSSISTETSEVCCRDLGGHWCSSDNACHPQSEECPPITGGNKVAGDWCYDGDGECASNKCGSSGICCSSSISTETNEPCCYDLGGHWCSSDNACHPQSEECPPITGGNKVAGDWCYEDGECASNKCGSSGICCSSSISTETNEPCCYDLGGHWCWDNKCRSQSEACPFKSSGAACWNDSECEFGCDYGTMTCN